MINSQRMINNFFDLVKIPSESEKDQEFVLFLKKFFEQIGAETKMDSYGNLLAKISDKNSKNSNPLFLSCHADTVSPGVGIEPVIKDGVISSRGETILGADDKAGIAVIIEAILSSEKHPPLEILITRNEEIGSIGAKNCDLYKFIEAKFGYAFDTEYVNEVILGGPTFIKLDFEFLGKPAHAGVEPEKGINAIVCASHAISRTKFGRIDSEATTNVGIIKGGTIRNGVPDKCLVLAEARSTVHGKCLELIENMEKVFTETAKEFSCKCIIKKELRCESYKLDEKLEVVSLVVSAMKRLKIKPDIKVINGGSDASTFNLKGIETVLLGCGFRDIHSNDEKAIVKDMDDMVKILHEIFYSM